MLFQISLGVDIRQDELCLVCLKASSRDVQLMAHAVYSIEEGIHGEEKTNAVLELIKGFMRENRISPASVFLGIPRSKAILRYLEYPIAVKENLRETLAYELEKHVPFRPEDVCFDFQIISENKVTDRLKLLLVVAKKQELSPILALSEQLSFGISGVGVSATALCDYFFWWNKKKNGIIRSFIYASGGHIELGLLKDGMLIHSRDLPKNEALVDVIPAALKKMCRDFSEDDDAFETVFCGMEKDDSFLKVFDRIEGITVRRLDLSRTQIPSTSLLVAYGLALKGVRKTSMDLNLLPFAMRKKPSKFKYYTMFMLASLVLLGALAWGGGVFFQRQWTLDNLDGEIKKLESKLNAFERLKTEKQILEDRIDYLNTLREGGPPVLNILRELSERVPKDAWLSRFNFSEKGIELEGAATSASKLIPLLEASPIFGDVAFLSAIRKQGNKDRFRIGLSLKQ